MYIMYMNENPWSHLDGPEASDPESLSVAQAREQFPSLLEAAEAGVETVISRRGRPVAMIAPLSLRRPRTVTLDSLIGTGARLWGDTPSKWVANQRDEWA